MLGTKHGQARNSRGVVAGAKKQSMEWLTRMEGETARISLSVEEIALKRAFFVWHGESLVWLVIWCTPHVPVCPSSGDNYSNLVRTLRCIIMTKIIAHKLNCKESLEVRKHGHVQERKEEL